MSSPIDPISFHLYGAIVALGVLAGFLLARSQAKTYKISSKEIENIYLLLIPSCLVGARAYHLLHQWEYYSQNPDQIMALWQGGLGIYGAIIGGITALFIYSKAKRLSFLTLLDLLAPSAALTQAIGRLANLFNQEVFGPPTNLPWKIWILPEKRPSFWQQYSYFHPLSLYESFLMFFGFLALFCLGPKYQKKKGRLAGAYFIIYGTIRFLTECGRFDTWQIAGFKLAHPLSLLCIIFGTYLLSKEFKSSNY